MESNLITCTNCNGQGLVSTGANKLDLRVGNKVTCPICAGSGEVPEGADLVGQEGTVVSTESPKAQDSSLNAPGGSESSDSSGAPLGPQIGSKCLTDTNQPGHLDKNEVGDWVCIPD